MFPGVGNVPPENAEALEETLSAFYPLFLPHGLIAYRDGMKPDELRQAVQDVADAAYAKKEAELGLLDDGTPLMRELERVVLLRVVDEYWMDHIDAMAELRRGIGLRGYGNVKPVDAYRQEASRCLRPWSPASARRWSAACSWPASAATRAWPGKAS